MSHASALRLTPMQASGYADERVKIDRAAGRLLQGNF